MGRRSLVARGLLSVENLKQEMGLTFQLGRKDSNGDQGSRTRCVLRGPERAFPGGGICAGRGSKAKFGQKGCSGGNDTGQICQALTAPPVSGGWVCGGGRSAVGPSVE